MTDKDDDIRDRDKSARETEFHEPSNFSSIENKAREMQKKHEERVKQKVGKDKVQKCGHWLEQQLHKTLGVCSKSYREWIHEYKGFLSKEDGYLDYNEWHVSAWSTGLLLGTYFIHELFAGLWVLITIRVVRDEQEEHSSLREIDMEMPYWFGFFIGGGLLLQALGFSADLNVLIELLGVLGL